MICDEQQPLSVVDEPHAAGLWAKMAKSWQVLLGDAGDPLSGSIHKWRTSRTQ